MNTLLIAIPTAKRCQNCAGNGSEQHIASDGMIIRECPECFGTGRELQWRKPTAIEGTDDARRLGVALHPQSEASVGEHAPLLDGPDSYAAKLDRLIAEAGLAEDNVRKHGFEAGASIFTQIKSLLVELREDYVGIARKGPARSEKLSNPEPRSGGGGLGAANG